MPIFLSGHFILASASPRRKELLRSVSLKFKTIPAHVNEDYLRGETPKQHVRRLAQGKAKIVSEKYPDAWVLGADTIVVIDGQILGKPENKSKAKKMLQKLSGRTHKVYTAFTIIRAASFIKSVRGSYTNVIGLPLCEVLEELKTLGVISFR